MSEVARERIWAEWIDRPQHWMDTYHKGGHQVFLERFWLDHVSRWQDLLPGQIVSWKSHVRQALYDDESGDGSIPDGARVVIFHGKPRPWDIGW
ncbi:hypothetical protein [Rhizobium mayense]|uniref:Uncharacterized protein n=1 Tax=Rhizobium mayense TaxID=1312184 RepID=A0ABT7K1Q1_9HYPH|nr:hypothetical protein [Rhizobium mayense]MDL2402546.1 hypothetical protein [Rhizobium mayense]